jgi:phosphoribosyl 1,2-cyclic phosphodiesterase
MRASCTPRRLTVTTLPTVDTQLWLLGSGSSGNALAVTHGEDILLVDAGYRLPVLVDRLRAAGLAPWYVSDVVLTHGHRDHVLGAAEGAYVYGWRVWGTLGTVWRWRALREARVRPFEPGQRFDAGPFRVHTAPTLHDVDDSAAVVVEAPGGGRVGVATDLGRATPAVRRLLGGVHVLVLEANYDPTLLKAGPYPPEVQARVASRTGHLSNDQAAQLARAVAHPGLTHVVLAHISAQNNTPELAVRRVWAALAGTAFRGTVLAAPRHEVLGPFAVAQGAPASDA